MTNLFTTNEVFDDLSVFGKIAEKNYGFKVAPAFRADKIMNVEAELYKEYLGRLGEIKDLGALEKILEKRLKEFISAGCKASDISVQSVYKVPDRRSASEVFEKRLNGAEITEEDAKIFKGYLTYFLMKLYAEYGVVTELHIGAAQDYSFQSEP